MWLFFVRTPYQATLSVPDSHCYRETASSAVPKWAVYVLSKSSEFTSQLRWLSLGATRWLCSSPLAKCSISRLQSGEPWRSYLLGSPRKVHPANWRRIRAMGDPRGEVTQSSRRTCGSYGPGSFKKANPPSTARRSLQRSETRKVESFPSDLYPLYEPTHYLRRKDPNPVTNSECQQTRPKDTVIDHSTTFDMNRRESLYTKKLHHQSLFQRSFMQETVAFRAS
jgi:hypothetical protein